ncbi:MAG: hypothetical protein CMF46_04700 [Legionellales bacterium]|nr:hypothetical protein [Legionellales bacterium]
MVKPIVQTRILISCALLLMIFIVIGYQLYSLQIIHNLSYQAQALKNRLHDTIIENERGRIFDRNGVTLASYRTEPTLHVPDQDSLKTLARILQKPNIEHTKTPTLIKQLSTEDIQHFYEHSHQMPNIKVREHTIRYYHDDEAFAHVVGYIGDRQEKNQTKISNKYGISGIEQYYDSLLSAHPSIKTYEYSSTGQRQNLVSESDGQRGNNITLTIDARLQKKAYELLKQYTGALVALNPTNGEILTLVSTPSYSNNNLIRGIHDSRNKHTSQLNRAINGQYPPASTIKPFIALHALSHNNISEQYQIHDPGYYVVGNKVFNDWYKKGQGDVNLNRAIALSSDTYFYHIAEVMGIDAIESVLSAFRFGQSPTLDLGHPSPGLVPSERWKLQEKSERWYTGDTVITAIGQGSLLATPLQMAFAAGILGNKGLTKKPHLRLSSEADSVTDSIAISQYGQKEYDIIIQAMIGVVSGNETLRTGRLLNSHLYDLAAKTGTAQKVSVEYASNNEDNKIKDHSMLIGFLPHDQPNLAFAIVIENQPGTANRIAKEWLELYATLYNGKIKD